MDIKNIALLIEYEGTSFCGWQCQPEERGPSVQGVLEKVLEDILGEHTTLYGSSRTDSGVHALGQVANFFTKVTVPADRWAFVLNQKLPPEIRVQASREMPLGFLSQRQVVSKTYVYRMLNRTVASALDRRVYFYPKPLDWESICAAAKKLQGTHDFKSFEGAKSPRRTTVRTLYRVEVKNDFESGIHAFEFEGSGFLKQMVRAMVGTLIRVGEGKLVPSDIDKILEARDRRKAGYTVPAAGLCLVDIRYPFEVFCRLEVEQSVRGQPSEKSGFSSMVPLDCGSASFSSLQGTPSPSLGGEGRL